ncbi:hypothetical protein HW115_03045 [Verrucomicrobiaceae bacterium N1E253]|uniref:Uncharacterized protein n=1 Tax=Oceaniferula marina TaxID=2748318 RepID=A0A851GCB3_9BACT|nr:hypothetical protein [Oceaniferula marina]NWK54572.1 hypothetical protein [Oceaniferula marina]
MRQFVLTIGTIVTALLSCWYFFQGISAIMRGGLENSLLYVFVYTPVLMSLTICFDHVNTNLHSEYRKLRRSLARKRGVQRDPLHPRSPEVEDTPWENDSSHTH